MPQASIAGLRASIRSKSKDRKSGSAGMPRPISYAVFCLKKKKKKETNQPNQEQTATTKNNPIDSSAPRQSPHQHTRLRLTSAANHHADALATRRRRKLAVV